MARRTICAALLPGMAVVAGLFWTAASVEAASPRGRSIPVIPRPVYVSGTIATVNSPVGTLSITPAYPANAAAVTVNVVAATTIVLDNTAVTLANFPTTLLPGMRVEAVYTTTSGVNTASLIKASDIFHVSGTIATVNSPVGTLSITPAYSANAAAVTVNVVAATTILLDGTAVTVANFPTTLLPGMRVHVVYKLTAAGNVASLIKASDIFRVSGTIAAGGVGATTLTITPAYSANAAAVTVTVGTATIVLDGTASTLANLLPGMRVEVVYKLTVAGNVASQIYANDHLRVTGTIQTVTPTLSSTTMGTVVINPAGNAVSNTAGFVTLTVNIGSGTTVNGGAVTLLSGLTVGARVEASYQVTSGGNIASYLQVGNSWR